MMHAFLPTAVVRRAFLPGHMETIAKKKKKKQKKKKKKKKQQKTND